MKYVYLRRIKDGRVLDIPESDVFETLRRGGFERAVPFVVNETVPKPEVVDTTIKCPLCEAPVATIEALNEHKPVCPKLNG